MKTKRWWDLKARTAAAFITTGEGGEGEGAGAGAEGTEGGEGTGGAGEGAGAEGGEGAGAADDPAKLFTPEEIQAKKDAVAAAQAEETRRAGLTPEQRAEEDRLKAEEDAKNQVPEKYEFKAPEGLKLNEAHIEKFSALAKEYGLSQDKAQALVEVGGDLVREVYAELQQQWDDKRAGWLSTAQADKEIGEDVKKGADSVAARAFATIATPEMKALMEELAIGDHPEVLRMFYRLGSRMKEDSFELPGAGSQLSTKDRAKTMYPSMEG